MKYIKIFFLHSQDALENRSRSIVWFLISLLNPLIYLLFWRGAAPELIENLTSYYFLLVIASSFLMVHIEEYIAWYDVKEGYLANHLLRPVSYFWQNFFHELPFRLLQGFFGIIVFVLFSLTSPALIQFVGLDDNLLFAVVIILGAFFLSFCLKMIVGISALFTTDFYGLSELLRVIILVFGGFVIPIDLFPDILKNVAFFLPFSYMFYFPIIAVAGQLAQAELVRVVTIQFGWIVVFLLLYRFLWSRGIRLFTGVGR